MRLLGLLLFLLVPLEGLTIQLSAVDKKVNDSLSSIVRYTKNDTLKAHAFLGLGRLHHGAMPDRAMYFYDRAIAACHQGLAFPLPKDKQTSFLNCLSGSMNNLSTIYRAKGDVKMELELSLGALQIKQYLGDVLLIGRSLYNLSETFLTLHDTVRSLDCLKRSIYFFTKIDHQKGLAYSYYKVGRILMSQRDTGNALHYYNLALEIETKQNDDYGKASTLNSLGQYYLETGKLELAFKLSREALRINQELKDQRGLLNSLYNMAHIEVKRNNLTAARRYGRRGYEIAEEIQYLSDIQTGALLLSEIYEKQGDYEAAYYFFGQYAAIHDSLLINKTKKNVVKNGIQEEYRQQRINDQFENQKNLDLSQQKIDDQKFFTGFVAFLLIALAMLSLWAWSRFRLYRKQNAVIDAQNAKIRGSLTYAGEMQKSLLPGATFLSQYFEEVILVHSPVEIVSGDFYWFRPFETYSVLVCADCKGYGVDGGFKSTIGSLLLDRIVRHDFKNPKSIIDELRRDYQAIIPVTGEKELPDVSVCIFNPSERVIDYAGLSGGITVISGKDAFHYPSIRGIEDGRYAVSGTDVGIKRIELSEGDWFFIYSDGLINQRGRNKQPMGYPVFEAMLKTVVFQKNGNDKSALVTDEMTKWCGSQAWTDDVLIVGCKI